MYSKINLCFFLFRRKSNGKTYTTLVVETYLSGNLRLGGLPLSGTPQSELGPNLTCRVPTKFCHFEGIFRDKILLFLRECNCQIHYNTFLQNFRENIFFFSTLNLTWDGNSVSTLCDGQGRPRGLLSNISPSHQPQI